MINTIKVHTGQCSTHFELHDFHHGHITANRPRAPLGFRLRVAQASQLAPSTNSNVKGPMLTTAWH